MVIDKQGNPSRPKYPRLMPGFITDISKPHRVSLRDGTNEDRAAFDPRYYDDEDLDKYWSYELTERAETRLKSDMKIYTDEMDKLLMDETKIYSIILSKHS